MKVEGHSRWPAGAPAALGRCHLHQLQACFWPACICSYIHAHLPADSWPPNSCPSLCMSTSAFSSARLQRKNTAGPHQGKDCAVKELLLLHTAQSES